VPPALYWVKGIDCTLNDAGSLWFNDACTCEFNMTQILSCLWHRLKTGWLKLSPPASLLGQMLSHGAWGWDCQRQPCCQQQTHGAVNYFPPGSWLHGQWLAAQSALPPLPWGGATLLAIGSLLVLLPGHGNWCSEVVVWNNLHWVSVNGAHSSTKDKQEIAHCDAFFTKLCSVYEADVMMSTRWVLSQTLLW